ncbi:diacylglycerol kinase family protein [Ferdinandcohnia quinoae]|uniref:Diacylglycerol kinase family protein n=1 Tax=Fredinandcohnia quinoae TaxID=2918902 RepID=A0AAW5E067_9BACI|nr:diacylglycerol kinase family protein [Fredinandcohnia sp. SECRCQ15]MCH1624974.1 diacylglycerol kinase family protein [Fredinandcohnia sp. SECRCQ15]
MDSTDKSRREWNRLIKSFSYACNGFKNAFVQERNLQIHSLISLIVIAAGFFFGISKSEWLVILLLIGGMITAELLNTAIERVVDLVTKDYHPLAKQAKDIAAAAVFVYAFTAIIIGLVIFLPYLNII